MFCQVLSLCMYPRHSRKPKLWWMKMEQKQQLPLVSIFTVSLILDLNVQPNTKLYVLKMMKMFYIRSNHLLFSTFLTFSNLCSYSLWHGFTMFLLLFLAAILLARSSPPWVTVDRPFLFLIRHNPTGTVKYVHLGIPTFKSVYIIYMYIEYLTSEQPHEK